MLLWQTPFLYINVLSLLFPHSQILVMEILAFCRRELRTIVHSSAQMLYNTIVAILTRIGFATHYELRIAILMLSGSRNKHNALEVELALIPSHTFFCKAISRGRSSVTLISRRTIVLSVGMKRLLLLEVKHCSRCSLNYNKVYSGANFIPFRIIDFTLSIIPDIGLQIWIHAYLGN